MKYRIGHGFDMHRLVPGRKLWLGGVVIPFDKGLQGHSDADVLIHAICDALLGAMAKGDIGKLFPDTDKAYKDIDSKVLLTNVYSIMRNEGWLLGNLDASILMQEPKLSPYIPAMCKIIAELLETELGNVSIKATTTEELGPEGRGEGVSAHAVTLIYKG